MCHPQACPSPSVSNHHRTLSTKRAELMLSRPASCSQGWAQGLALRCSINISQVHNCHSVGLWLTPGACSPSTEIHRGYSARPGFSEEPPLHILSQRQQIWNSIQPHWWYRFHWKNTLCLTLIFSPFAVFCIFLFSFPHDVDIWSVLISLHQNNIIFLISLLRMPLCIERYFHQEPTWDFWVVTS